MIEPLRAMQVSVAPLPRCDDGADRHRDRRAGGRRRRGGVPSVGARRRVRRAVVVLLDVDVVAGVDHFIEAADVIAMLMAADDVVESVGRLHADRLADTGRRSCVPLPVLPASISTVMPVGTFDEDRAAPSDVDVVDLEVLRGEREGDEEQEHRDE